MKYLPKQPKTNDSIIYESKGDYCLKNGELYFGKYHINNGIRYTGTPDNLIKEVLYDTLKVEDPTYETYYYTLNKKEFDKYVSPNPYIPIITIKDYVKSYLVRYFIKRRNSVLPIMEIDERQYNTLPVKFFGIDENLYDGIKLEWKIYGSKNDIKDLNGNIIEYGIIDTNYRTLKQKENEMQGISKALPDLMQYGKVSKIWKL